MGHPALALFCKEDKFKSRVSPEPPWAQSLSLPGREAAGWQKRSERPSRHWRLGAGREGSRVGGAPRPQGCYWWPSLKPCASCLLWVRLQPPHVPKVNLWHRTSSVEAALFSLWVSRYGNRALEKVIWLQCLSCQDPGSGDEIPRSLLRGLRGESFQVLTAIRFAQMKGTHVFNDYTLSSYLCCFLFVFVFVF